MKKALPLLIALVVIAALVVVLMLTVFKPKAPAEPSPSETPTATPPVETDSPDPTGEPITPSPDGNGASEYVVEVGSVRYSVTVKTDDFDVTETASGRRYTLKTLSGVFFETSYIPDKTALSAAPAFLDAYIDYLELETAGKNFIPGTEIAGEMVVGTRGDESCTAWLVDVEGGVVALTVSYSGEIPQTVYNALATFTIE